LCKEIGASKRPSDVGASKTLRRREESKAEKGGSYGQKEAKQGNICFKTGLKMKWIKSQGDLSM